MRVLERYVTMGGGEAVVIDALASELETGSRLESGDRWWRVRKLETFCRPRVSCNGKRAGVLLEGGPAPEIGTILTLAG